MRMLARREPTMALHVHVGVPDPEDAVRLLAGLRRHAPLLLALSGNSPFWQGRDGGFSSARTVLFHAFPRTGLPPFCATYADYVRTIDPLIASGAIPDASFLWWDVRLQPALGTVEVRVMDAQSTVTDVAALVALVQSIARAELEDDHSSFEPSAEILAENCFVAARDGIDARLIEPTTNRLQPVETLVEDVLDRCRPHARILGCSEALAGVERIVMATGADRQRARVAKDGRLDHLVAGLAEDFLSTPVAEATAAEA